MSENTDVVGRASHFAAVLNTAARLPGVRIDRAAYLRSALKGHCTPDVVAEAVEQSPAAAGIPVELLARAASESVRFETLKVTALSTAAGILGGPAVNATTPADAA